MTIFFIYILSSFPFLDILTNDYNLSKKKKQMTIKTLVKMTLIRPRELNSVGRDNAENMQGPGFESRPQKKNDTYSKYILSTNLFQMLCSFKNLILPNDIFSTNRM
jgi:hypothetical protein